MNTPAVRVIHQGGGPRAVAEVAGRRGVEGRFGRDASVVLGTGEATLLDMSAAYAALANGGRRVTPYGMARIEGVTLAMPAMPQVLEPAHAAMMRQMMLATVARGSGRGAAVPGVTVGGKTGTTQDYRDAWFLGFVQMGGQVTAIGIWLGNDDNQGMEDVKGGTLPARLFREIVEAARAGG